MSWSIPEKTALGDAAYISTCVIVPDLRSVRLTEEVIFVESFCFADKSDNVLPFEVGNIIRMTAVLLSWNLCKHLCKLFFSRTVSKTLQIPIRVVITSGKNWGTFSLGHVTKEMPDEQLSDLSSFSRRGKIYRPKRSVRTENVSSIRVFVILFLTRVKDKRFGGNLSIYFCATTPSSGHSNYL